MKNTKLSPALNTNTSNLILELDEKYDLELNEYNDLRSLWRAAVLQSLYDIRLKPTNKKNRSAKNKATKWLDINNEDFIEVCTLAEFDPKKVLDLANPAEPMPINGVKFINNANSNCKISTIQ